MEYNNEDVKRELDKALQKLVDKYGGPPEKTGIRANENGSYTVFVNDGKGPEYWFKNEFELSSWILGVNNEN